MKHRFMFIRLMNGNIRDWSLIMGRRGYKTGGGGQVKLYPYENGGGGGRTSFSHAEGGGVQPFLGSSYTVA